MKTPIAMAGALALLLSLPAAAAESACMSVAAQKKLSGAAENAFVRKCERDQCDAAMDKRLYGAAKMSYMKKCMAERLKPYCEAKADARKLRGAARTSFLDKCQTD